MGRRDFQSTVVDALPKVIEQEAKNSIGSIKFSRKDKKTIGKLYVRGGLIYAIELNNYTPNVVNRIATNEYVSDSARQQILDRFGKDPKNFDVVKFVLTAQLFPEKPLMGYIKDYFLDAFDELYSWDEVNVEWRLNDEPSIPTVPNVSPDDLLEKARLRREYLETKISPEWNSTPKAMEDLGFRKNYDYDNQDYTTALLLNVADGKWTVGTAAHYLGMSFFNVKKHLFELWQEGVIDILHPSGLTITNRSPDDIRKNSSNMKVKSDSKPKSVPELEEMPDEAISASSSQPAPLYQPQQTAKPFIPQTVQKETIVTNTPPQFSVASAPSVNSGGLTTTPPVNSAPASQQPAPPSVPAPSGASASSRISQLAQQLKAEVSTLDATIANEQANREQLNAYAQSLRTEKQALLAKLAEMDSRIQMADNDVAQKDAEIKQLHASKAEITSLLGG